MFRYSLFFPSVSRIEEGEVLYILLILKLEISVIRFSNQHSPFSLHEGLMGIMIVQVESRK